MMYRTNQARRKRRTLGAVLTLFVLAVLAVAVAHGIPAEGRSSAKMPMSPGGEMGMGMGMEMDSMGPMRDGPHGDGAMHGAMHGMAAVHGMTGGHHGMHGSHPMSGAGAEAPEGTEDGVPHAHECAGTGTDAAPR